MNDKALYELAVKIGKKLKEKKQRLVAAESCTGGWIAKCCTDVPGSSEWFDRGFVTYSNQAKQEMFGVSEALLVDKGAVSEAVVKAMADGAIAQSNAHWAVSVSGIAGPGGGSDEKPVGTVWVAWKGPGKAYEEKLIFDGDREAVRRQTVAHVLTELSNLL